MSKWTFDTLMAYFAYPQSKNCSYNSGFTPNGLVQRNLPGNCALWGPLLLFYFDFFTLVGLFG